MSRTCLVTGGAGFIGSNLTLELVRRRWRVRVLDNLATGRLQNLEPVLDQIEFIQGDVRNREDVERAVKGVEFVFHQAALPSVPRSVEDPLSTNEVNVTGTLNLLLAARDLGVRRVVIASSSSVYGNIPVLPKSEELKPCPASPYAVSKLAQELYAKNFWELYGLSTVCLRYFNVFGPRQDPQSQYAAVIPRFIAALLCGRNPVIYGDGNQSRDFTFVADVVEANLRAAEAEGVDGEVFNVARGENVTINDLLGMLGDITGVALTAEHQEPRPGDVRHSRADITKARRLLGYVPQYGLHEGLEETVKWFRQHL
ncbi:MAG: SDR family oxidoreductase [Firmicutes bacterium]|nr:SDR family oxidoreductase [Bacillota bacterium]